MSMLIWDLKVDSHEHTISDSRWGNLMAPIYLGLGEVGRKKC